MGYSLKIAPFFLFGERAVTEHKTPALIDATEKFEALTEDNLEAYRLGLKQWRGRLQHVGGDAMADRLRIERELEHAKIGFKPLSLALGPDSTVEEQLSEATRLCTAFVKGLEVLALPLTEEEQESVRITVRNFAIWSLEHGRAMVDRMHERQDAEKKKPPE